MNLREKVLPTFMRTMDDAVALISSWGPSPRSRVEWVGRDFDVGLLGFETRASIHIYEWVADGPAFLTDKHDVRDVELNVCLQYPASNTISQSFHDAGRAAAWVGGWCATELAELFEESVFTIMSSGASRDDLVLAVDEIMARAVIDG